MPRQLAFDLPVRPALGREDFFVSPANELALAALDAGGWPQGKMLLLGPEGSGKSHLAQVWAGDTGARVIVASDLATLPLPEAGPMVVEDADRIAGDRVAETALFHLHNHLLAAEAPLLLTAWRGPTHWGLILPDLKSRMEATATAELLPPDDALLSAVCLKLFADRQLQVTPALIQWLIRRIDRSFAAARATVATLDAVALQRGRPVTRALAAEVLDTAPHDDA
ncbi:DnaA/Hda family protein [Defluviimonas aestuarii]|uniref:DnaA ATPase domain-containing protein n=1 Tax=Albidovulum aestuarii TaxID=1130726 RepID=UPI002499C3E5|nr:DnaA/Hda family protein [Defluviimonas aestuarii]MDI3335225.1 DnaA/Hda family protein [Defluviimonas aestuarii]